MACIHFPYGMEETTDNEARPDLNSSGDTEAWKNMCSKTSGESLLDKQWVTFGGRVTFTFAFGNEVGSVHFDRSRGEIFFKGHNIRNMELEPWHWQVLEKMRDILKSHAKLRNFINPYDRLLDKIALEKAPKDSKAPPK